MAGRIDCNVHEPFDQRGVDRFIDPVWQGWHAIIPALPYREPNRPAPVSAASFRETVSSSGADIAVLTGTIHPGNAVTQFEYHAAFARAYNDWVAADFLDADDRLYGSIQVASQLPDEAAAEIERMAAHPKMLQVVLPARGGEGFGLARYRPIFEAAVRHDLVIALHLSASTETAAGFPEFLAEWHAGRAQSFMGQVLSLVFSGILDELPGLRLLLSGGGFTWLPYLAWTMDSNYRPLRAEVPWVTKLPSTYLPGRVWFDVHPIPPAATDGQLRDMIEMAGHEGWLVHGSDYPNRGWSGPEEVTTRDLGGSLSEAILAGNARDLYAPRLARVGAGT